MGQYQHDIQMFSEYMYDVGHVAKRKLPYTNAESDGNLDFRFIYNKKW